MTATTPVYALKYEIIRDAEVKYKLSIISFKSINYLKKKYLYI